MTTPTVRPLVLGARLAERWAGTYTRRLSPETAAARRDEIAADVFDHEAAAKAAGQSAAATSRAIAARMLLGVPADLSWRHHHLRAERHADRKENVVIQPADKNGAHFAAAIAGALVILWTLLVGVLSTIYAVENDLAFNWGAGAFLVLVAAVGILGLVRLARDKPSGAFLLASAAVGSTIWFLWIPVISLVGFACAAGFIAYGMSIESASDAVSLEPVQG